MPAPRKTAAKQPADRKPPAKSTAARTAPRKTAAAKPDPEFADRARAASRAVVRNTGRSKRPLVETEKFAADALPPGVPDGAPELVSLVGLSRRQRADFMVALQRLRKSLNSQGIDVDSESVDEAKVERLLTDDPAQVVVLLADIQDLLAPIAADRDGFEIWAAKCTDVDLMRVFHAYTADLGEASASPA